ncbi:10679_t:CDS:2, partial [Cetraspora pellucida]
LESKKKFSDVSSSTSLRHSIKVYEFTLDNTKQRIIETPDEDPEPVISQRIVLDTLVTYDYKKKKYVPILTKNGEITKRYPGGIFVQYLY